jgi:hypothetical protein
MKEYVLDEPLTEEFLKFLGHFGTVRFMEHLKKPYFSFEQEYFISIKGFAGDANVEVRYNKNFQDLLADYFHLLLYYERQGVPGIVKMNGIVQSIRDRMKIRLDAD